MVFVCDFLTHGVRNAISSCITTFELLGAFMKKFLLAVFVGLFMIGGTVAVTHYMADSSVAAAEPNGG